MDKKGILELKRRMTKDGCTFTKMTGCYVDGEKNKIVNIDENFLGLEEEEEELPEETIKSAKTRLGRDG